MTPTPNAANEYEVLGAGAAIVIEGNVVVKIDESETIEDEYGVSSSAKNPSPEMSTQDLEGAAVVPGLIDTHTHLLWAGDRSQEVRWRQEGMTYGQIAELGGGIRHTVDQTRNASKEQLSQLGYVRLREALHTGTTHLEAKSGYGLDVESELRLLEVSQHLGSMNTTPTIDPTWMGAHDIPEGMEAGAYVDSLLQEQLPAVLEQGIARSADVFCEPGWFSVEHTSDILAESKRGGLALRMHIDEFVDGRGSELACEFRVASADHAYHTPMEDRLMMKDAGVMTGFLPGTPYAMGDLWPDMGEITSVGIPYTLASDFNPNCRTLSLPFMTSLMVQRCGVHPLAALSAVTVRAAETTPHPSGRVHGQIVEGSVANLNIVDGKNWESVVLRPTGTPFAATILNGQYVAH
jgi:imidazolonepropionase